MKTLKLRALLNTVDQYSAPWSALSNSGATLKQLLTSPKHRDVSS